jgi:hypothetical protein
VVNAVIDNEVIVTVFSSDRLVRSKAFLVVVKKTSLHPRQMILEISLAQLNIVTGECEGEVVTESNPCCFSSYHPTLEQVVLALVRQCESVSTTARFFRTTRTPQDVDILIYDDLFIMTMFLMTML